MLQVNATYIYSSLINYLTAYNCLTSTQHVFRASFSCRTQLLGFYHDISLSYDNHKQVNCIFKDFRDAFDIIPHSCILEELARLNIGTNTCRWITNYLMSRKQLGLVNGVKSTSITAGICPWPTLICCIQMII